MVELGPFARFRKFPREMTIWEYEIGFCPMCSGLKFGLLGQSNMHFSVDKCFRKQKHVGFFQKLSL